MSEAEDLSCGAAGEEVRGADSMSIGSGFVVEAAAGLAVDFPLVPLPLVPLVVIAGGCGDALCDFLLLLFPDLYTAGSSSSL